MPALSTSTTEYIDQLLAKGTPIKTVKGQAESLRAFVRAVGNLDTAKVDSTHVARFFGANLQWQPGTRNNRLSHLNLFFKWCRFRRYMPVDSDPTYGWKALRYIPAEKMLIPRNEWPRLFSACQDELETILLATGLYVLTRGSEVQGIQLKHVKLNGAKPVIQIVRIKNKQRALLPIIEEYEPYVRDHLTWMAQNGWTSPNHYLIPTHYSPLNAPGNGRFVVGSRQVNPNKPICRPYDKVKAILDRAGYATYWEGVHTLRRSGARAMFDALCDRGYDGALRKVQAMLGHAKSATTERYLGISLDEMMLLEEFAGQPLYPCEPTNVVAIREVNRG